MPLWKVLLKKLTRKKVLAEGDVQKTDLRRCLTTLDLVGLGIGCTLGAGMYVVSGQVAHEDSGPAVIISFLVAAVASALAALCYAEFAARIPRAGSAYVYSYISVGELMAFIIGWNLVLEYIIGTSTLSRSWSNYVDDLCDNRISHFFNSTMPIRAGPQFSEYPDLLAVALTFLFTAILGLGVKESVVVNNVFTVVNLLVVLYITICGFFKMDWHNWDLTKEEIPSSAGEGGFMPYGFSGMMAGAATCFYAFIGFDVIATTGEETKNPQRSIPIAIMVSLLIVFLCYFSVSGVITLMCPYYLLDRNAPLPQVFNKVGWGVARYVISTGAIAGLSTSLLAGLLPLPRILYAMGTDGVIFKFMGKVSPRFQTPIIGTIISGLLSAFLAMVFNVKELVKMMSIGTLLAYTLVANCVLLLRYERDGQKDKPTIFHESHIFEIKKLLFPGVDQPTLLTSRITKVAICFMSLNVIVLSAVLVFFEECLQNREAWSVIAVTVLGTVLLVCLVVIHRQPQNSVELVFKVPFLPYIPAASSFINIYLMFKLSVMTWIRFGIWMAIGFIIYGISGWCYASDIESTEHTNTNDKASHDGPVDQTEAKEESKKPSEPQKKFNEKSKLLKLKR